MLIGIPTYKRPEQLASLLESLAAQVVQHEAHILVVDNDPKHSAESVVASFRVTGLPVTYSAEARPGVVHVRNQILQSAKQHDAVIFVDDDEVVGPTWLQEFCLMHAQYPSAVISGRVDYLLPSSTPAWITAGGYFDRHRHEHGERLASTGAGNTLIPSTLVHRETFVGFDPDFQFSGGEDSEFFERVARSGTSIIWCDAAVAREAVPPERLTWRWIRSRLIQSGFVRGRLNLRSRSRVRVWGDGTLRVVAGCSMCAFDVLQLRRPTQRAVGLLFGGIGHWIAAIPGDGVKSYGK